MRLVLSALLLLCCAGFGCARAEAASAPSPATPQTPASGAPPVSTSDELVELVVPGYEPAVVSIPAAGSRKRPLLVAAHGAWDRPEPHCRLWRRVTEARGFVLCPRGKRTNRYVPREHAAYYYPDHFDLAREVLAGIAALSARYPNEVDVSAAVWAGFSQGAIHGALVTVLYPQQFPRAALVEGGNGFFDEWSPYAARKYARGGGQRVLFGCGSRYCVRTAQRCAGFLAKTGVQTRVAHAEGAGHSYGPAMERRLREQFEWLVAGDARWTR